MKSGNWTNGRGFFLLSFLTVLFLTEATLSAQYTISPIAGGGGYTFDGTGVAVDLGGNVYATAWNGGPFVVKVNPSGGTPTPVAGSNYGSPYWGTNTCNTSSPTNIGLTGPVIAVDGSGSVYVAQSGNSPIVKVNGNTFTCPFGNIDYSPLGIAVDSTGNIYFGDTDTDQFHKGAVTFASIYLNCANGPFGKPFGLAIDAAGNLYVADNVCNVIWKVTPQLNITPVAGAFHATGQINCPPNNVGDGGPATNACLDAPSGVAVDPYGNLYIADTGNNRVRKVDSVSHDITTIADNSFDGSPYSIAIGQGSTIYVGVHANATQTLNYALYELTPTGAMIVSPAPGSMLHPPVTFTWSGAPVGSSYQLDVGDNSIVPGTNYGGNLFVGSTYATTSPQIYFACDGKTLYAQLTTNNPGVAGFPQTGLYTYTACMLTLSVSPSYLPQQGGVVTITATVASQTSQTVTLKVTGSLAYPHCVINPVTHVCVTPSVTRSNVLNLSAGIPQTVTFQDTFPALPATYPYAIYNFAATLTGAQGLLDSTAINLRQN